jgi:hypothetical protein
VSKEGVKKDELEKMWKEAVVACPSPVFTQKDWRTIKWKYAPLTQLRRHIFRHIRLYM